jgi:hypothetical protein
VATQRVGVPGDDVEESIRPDPTPRRSCRGNPWWSWLVRRWSSARRAFEAPEADDEPLRMRPEADPGLRCLPPARIRGSHPCPRRVSEVESPTSCC